MKNKIVYYALGAVALYYLYDWYKKKQPVQTPILPGTNVMQEPVQKILVYCLVVQFKMNWRQV